MDAPALDFHIIPLRERKDVHTAALGGYHRIGILHFLFVEYPPITFHYFRRIVGKEPRTFGSKAGGLRLLFGVAGGIVGTGGGEDSTFSGFPGFYSRLYRLIGREVALFGRMPGTFGSLSGGSTQVTCILSGKVGSGGRTRCKDTGVFGKHGGNGGFSGSLFGKAGILYGIASIFLLGTGITGYADSSLKGAFPALTL